MARLIELFTALFLTVFQVNAYKPLVIIHGLLSSPSHYSGLAGMVTKAHPGTNVTVIRAYDGAESLSPLWEQVQKFRSEVKAIVDQSPEGIHILCYSQGGIICRGLIATYPDHKIDSFISLSGPLLGQYGETDYINKFLPKKYRKDIYKFCYENPLGQEVSICNYWNDPHQHEAYLKKNIYLPQLNNETNNPNSIEWKANFLKLKQVVLIGGPGDGVITPWQSSQFGFYDADENVVEMQKQEVFMKDSFGLQSLYNSGRVHTCTVPGVEHTNWHDNQMVFDKCIEQWLT